MSKLSKFRSHIRFDEAAALLSRLIGEPVSIDQLVSLHELGWIPVFRPGFFEIIKLIPDIPKDEYLAHARDSRYFVKPSEEEIQLCFGFYYPYTEAYAGSKRLIALHGQDGQIYALREPNTQEYLLATQSNESDPEIEELLIATKDIYDIAEIANNSSIEPPRPCLSRKAECTYSDIDIFNFLPDTSVEKQSSTQHGRHIENNQSPTFLLAISALLELCLDINSRRRTQELVISEIRDKYPDWKLSQSTLQKIFATANSAARAQGIPPKRAK
ncbi:hypothetical protein [Pseudomonas aeruginosa]|uniref:hypothetical protein n=1 Tax=Pseudomonas aeruginosa TaxID=287 RepID=UPI0029C0A95E|nr:hypothetical protein [Pseudomonas aeruginosa]